MNQSNVIISPHTDDAIFSIASKIGEMEDVKIVSPMAGIPTDDIGKMKHTLLRAEHQRACDNIGAEVSNGDFLDDVYDAPYRSEIANYLVREIAGASSLYVPMGIHHPDHLLISNLVIDLFKNFRIDIDNLYFYNELPYAYNYSELAEERRKYVENTVGSLFLSWGGHGTLKRKEFITFYGSQTGSGLLDTLSEQDEKIWKLNR